MPPISYRCPSCGKETEYREELEGLCVACFRKKHQINISGPIRLTIKICPICYRIFFGSSWRKPSIHLISQIISKEIKKNKPLRNYEISLPEDFNARELIEDLLSENSIIINVNLEKKSVSIQSVQILITPKKQVCPICMKKLTGSYYEFVIHVRFPRKEKKRFFDIIDQVIRRFSRGIPLDEVIDIKRLSSGLDIRISSRDLGRRLLVLLENVLNTKSREYVERRFDSSLKKSILVHKAMIEI